MRSMLPSIRKRGYMEHKGLTLKGAITKGKLKQFIKEHAKDRGDKEQFDTALSSMVGKSKEAQKSSSQDDSEN